MGKLIFEESKEEVEIEEGQPIKKACMAAGVLFGCEDGYCGTCRIQIGEGKENLSEKTQEERDLTGSSPELRLACQCSIRSGNVKIINY